MVIPPAPGAGVLPPAQIFADVPPSNEWYPYVQQLALLGITAGTQAATPGNLALYSPDAPLTRGEAAAFITRALALIPNSPFVGSVPLDPSL
jgi:hypothetical protein